MKTITFLFLLSLSFNLFAAEFLTSEQADTILTEIDNICGDTWCEGEFNFSFDHIQCDDVTATCRIDMTLFNGYEDFEEGDKEFKGSCEIDQLSTYSDMIDTTRRYASLNWDFYERLTDCVTDLEQDAYSVVYED